MNPNDPNLKDDSNKPLESSENGAEKPVYPKEASQDSSFKEEPPKREAEQKIGQEAKKIDAAMDYLHGNLDAAITYSLLAIGILLLIFNVFLLGSIIVGLIAGYHFSYEIIFYLRNLTQIFAGQEQVRYIVLTAVIIALFIAIPGIFIGAIVAAVIRQVIMGEGKT